LTDKFWCVLPFTDVNVFKSTITPCCDFKSSKPESLDTYFSSQTLSRVKQQLLDGQAPKECNTCVVKEQQSGHSFRILANKFKEDESVALQQSANANTWAVSQVMVVPNNVCNLKCLSCNGGASFIRGVELEKLGLEFRPRLTKNPNLDRLLDLEFETLTISGGEPFGDGATLPLLEKLIKSGRSKHIRIDINTNLTLLKAPILDNLVNNFKKVYIKGSIDGFGKVNEYLRYPSKWEDIEQAMMLLKNTATEHCITTTISNLALLRSYELINWATDFGVRSFFVTPVLNPSTMAADCLPNTLKQQLLPQYTTIKNKFSEQSNPRLMHYIDTCIHLCQPSDREKNWPAAVSWLTKHDQLRGTNYLDVFPELIGY
jgi:hypothetical protein